MSLFLISSVNLACNKAKINNQTPKDNKADVALVQGPCPYPCGDLRCKNYSELNPNCPPTVLDPEPPPVVIPEIHLEYFFNSYNSLALISPDTLMTKAYLIEKNNSLIGTLSQNFPNSYKRNEMNQEDEIITYAGLIHMLAEEQGFFRDSSTMPSQQAIRMAPWVDCVVGVLSGYLSVDGLISAYSTLIKEGAKWSTIRPFIKYALKRYGGWITVGWAIYDISTKCFS